MHHHSTIYYFAQACIKHDGLKEPFPLSNTNFRYLYWDIKQQLVHHTVTGCNTRPGDLLASGTISGPVRPHSHVACSRCVICPY